MARYCGRASAKQSSEISRQIVEIAAPAGGLGKTLDAMYDFHARH
jgi:hypothetical protein